MTPNPTVPAKQLTLPGMSKSELDRLEGKIRAGLKSFVEVGAALQEIREKRGYLIRGHKDFETYCQKEFHFSLRQGERLMLAAQTAETVKKITGDAPPNEAVARVLTGVAKDEGALRKVVASLKKKGQTIATATAETVQQVMESVTAKPKGPDHGHDPAAVRATAPMLEHLTDTCPNCKTVPRQYEHIPGGWECGECHAPVRVSALPLELVACKECGKPILDESGLCRSCGAVL